jgi:hypothetical protein
MNFIVFHTCITYIAKKFANIQHMKKNYTLYSCKYSYSLAIFANLDIYTYMHT